MARLVCQSSEYSLNLNANHARRVLVVKLSETEGEEQYRFQCKSCGCTLGYRNAPQGQSCKATFVFADMFVAKQLESMKYKNV